MTLRRRLKQWLYGSCPGIAGAFPYFGTRIYFPQASIVFEAACAAGIYEADNLRVLQAFAAPGTTVFDVGANIGLMSVPVLAAKSDVRVVSFEAAPTTLQYLMRTREGSAFRDRWEIVAKAAGGAAGTVEFQVGTAGEGAYDGFRHTGRASLEKVITVEVTTLDLEWRRRGSPAVSAIKIDVEGAELDVLDGAAECIAACCPAIVAEWSQRNIAAYGRAVDDLLSSARRIGYRLWTIPQFAEIGDTVALQMHSSLTESYLLYPGSPR